MPLAAMAPGTIIFRKLPGAQAVPEAAGERKHRERGKVAMARLQDKVALITGGESGIGLAAARLFVAEGASVHLVGIDETKLSAAVDELGHERALRSIADVTDEDAVGRAVAAGVDRYGRFDVVVSNAGISGAVAEITDYPSEVFARTLAVHVLGAFHVLKHTVPHMPDGGSVIITSSVVGLIGPPGVSGYVAAKHAQVGLMRTAAKELAPRRIRVNTIHPGPTSTGFQDDIEMRATRLPREEAAKAFDAMIPLGRHATTEEIAHGMLYLAADESAMVTSHTLSIDGGMSG
jgi:NAD(P)-dependent dehydrogenase (short-subunit alcohol dehydrogenase family)